MNDADGLLASALEAPDDEAVWLVLADWLEEQGRPDDLARAELLRLLPEWPGAKKARQKELDRRVAEVFAERPELAGGLAPLLKTGLPLLSEPAALAIFLLGEQTSVVPGPLTAGTTWQGELLQATHAFPTTLHLRRRQGNQFEGDMTEDFSSMYGAEVSGTFYFRGVVAGGAHAAFVTYRLTGAASGPGLYQFRLNRLGRMSGTWRVGLGWKGKMWLKQRDE
jgi:uncharacterized protein (TIGR02996 family)